MKNIFLIIIIISSFTSCQAQQIRPLDNPINYAEEGIYYKDVNNVLNPFVGTYIYTNGNEIFKIELRKMLHSSRNDIYFEDALIGAYEYKINNIVNANTFANLNTSQTDRWNYRLNASLIFIGDDWQGCETCQTNTLWISGYIDSITNIGSNEIRFKRIVHNGQQALRVVIVSGDAIGISEGQIKPVRQPNSYPCCNQEFIMIKQ